MFLTSYHDVITRVVNATPNVCWPMIRKPEQIRCRANYALEGMGILYHIQLVQPPIPLKNTEIGLLTIHDSQQKEMLLWQENI